MKLLLAACLSAVLVGDVFCGTVAVPRTRDGRPLPVAEGTARKKIPFIYCSDIFHPAMGSCLRNLYGELGKRP